MREPVCAMAFGPGLTVEMALLEAERGAGHGVNRRCREEAVAGA
jgi:hypothetical protein